ncbi:MAG TPA: lysophospholipid acyltransferase family protein [Puia sp.]|nr:lysophospholipid acyltransferase family protein [Puia sp.]
MMVKPLARIALFPFRLAYCLYALLLFVAGIVLVLPFVAFFSFQPAPRGGNRIYRICRWWDMGWLTLVGIRHRNRYESEPDPRRQYIFISNHISYLDIPMILRAIRRDSIRVLGKVEMARIPLFGYIYSRAVVMVDRRNAQERSRSVRELKGVLSMGVSVFIFPEGTFNETGLPLKEFFDGAFRIAIETQTPLQPILFLGTYELMHYRSIFSLRPGRLQSVFLPAVEVQGLGLADLPVLKERVYRQMEANLLKYEAPWVTVGGTRKSS